MYEMYCAGLDFLSFNVLKEFKGSQCDFFSICLFCVFLHPLFFHGWSPGRCLSKWAQPLPVLSRAGRSVQC